MAQMCLWMVYFVQGFAVSCYFGVLYSKGARGVMSMCHWRREAFFGLAHADVGCGGRSVRAMVRTCCNGEHGEEEGGKHQGLAEEELEFHCCFVLSGCIFRAGTAKQIEAVCRLVSCS